MSKIKFSGIHHTAFATADMDKTVRYWKDFLGMAVLIAINDTEGRQYAFSVSESMVIYFFEWPNVESVAPKRHGQPVEGPFIFDHLALNLQSLIDLHLLQDRLVENGYPVSDIMDHGFINSIYTYDPNGIPLEFNVLKPGFDLRMHPVHVDKNPVPGIDEPPCEKAPSGESLDDLPRPVIKGTDAIYFEMAKEKRGNK